VVVWFEPQLSRLGFGGAEPGINPSAAQAPVPVCGQVAEWKSRDSAAILCPHHHHHHLPLNRTAAQLQ
jgi:hypothetical protein